jgi:hypothetical protein
MYGAAHSVRIRPGFVPHDAPAGAAQGAPPCADAGVPAAHTIEIQIARYESMSIDFILVVLIMLEHENRMVFICVTVSVYAVSGSEYRFPRGSPFANGLVSVQSPPRRIR